MSDKEQVAIARLQEASKMSLQVYKQPAVGNGQTMRTTSADFSRTCEGCGHVETETLPKGMTGYRCFALGPRRGRMVGIDFFEPWIPAWCPMMEQERAEGLAYEEHSRNE